MSSFHDYAVFCHDQTVTLAVDKVLSGQLTEILLTLPYKGPNSIIKTARKSNEATKVHDVQPEGLLTIRTG